MNENKLCYAKGFDIFYARYIKKKMTIAEFEQWSRFASDIRDKTIQKEIAYEDYYKEIRK